MTWAQPSAEATSPEIYTVEAFDQFYFARFHKGRAFEVQVRVKRSSGWRDLRTLWSRTGYRMSATPKGRAAEIIACVLNPEFAEKHKAVVADQAVRDARARAETERRQRMADEELRTRKALAEQAARQARIEAAAPWLLTALERMLTTPAILAFLEENDSYALAMAREAVEKAKPQEDEAA